MLNNMLDINSYTYNFTNTHNHYIIQSQSLSSCPCRFSHLSRPLLISWAGSSPCSKSNLGCGGNPSCPRLCIVLLLSLKLHKDTKHSNNYSFAQITLGKKETSVWLSSLYLISFLLCTHRQYDDDAHCPAALSRLTYITFLPLWMDVRTSARNSKSRNRNNSYMVD
jgi:hypothetical protein